MAHLIGQDRTPRRSGSDNARQFSPVDALSEWIRHGGYERDQRR